MGLNHISLLSKVADVSASSGIIHDYIHPLLLTLTGLGSLAAVFFLTYGGILYITSSGKPDSLEHAKRVIRNSLIGLILIIAAGTMTNILTQAYTQPQHVSATTLPALTQVQPKSTGISLVTILIKAITGVLESIITTAGEPFIKALNFFTSGTPLMGDNSTVFNLWLVILAIADALFVGVVALLGFHIMSASTFGFEELEFKQLLPKIGVTFLLMNCSLFIVDTIIGLCNAMIHAISQSFPASDVWKVLTDIVNQSGGLGLAALLIMIIFLILTVVLLVYYVGRLVTLYIGAALSPIVFMMLIIPGFKDFAISAIKTYISTIFVLFVHVVILVLAASIFSGLVNGSPDHTADPIMALIVGLATVVALLKTQGTMMQFTYASIGPKTARKLGAQFVNSISYLSTKTKAVSSSVSNKVSNSRASTTFNNQSFGLKMPSLATASVSSNGSRKANVSTESVPVSEPKSRSIKKEEKE